MRVRLAMLVLTAGVTLGGVGVLATQERAWAGGSLNGVAGSMPAYYDHKQFTINFKEFTSSEATLLAKNGQQNVIWQSDPGLPGGQPFISVIDAIPGDGMNPLWAEVQITFVPPNVPRQLFSDDEIAAARASGEIVCTPTNEMYRCSVTAKPKAASVSIDGASGAPATSTVPASQSWGALKRLYR